MEWEAPRRAPMEVRCRVSLQRWPQWATPLVTLPVCSPRSESALAMFCALSVVTATQLHTSVKTHQTVHLKWMTLTICSCSVTRLCPTLCNPVDCSKLGFPVLHHLPELAQTQVHWVSDAIQPSHPLPSPSPFAFNLSQHESSQVSWLFTLGGQSTGASASASVLPMNIQDWFPLGMTGLISLQSKELTRVFCNTTFRKHQFFLEPMLLYEWMAKDDWRWGNPLSCRIDLNKLKEAECKK